MAKENIVIIDYTNHRGERREREIIPIEIVFGGSKWHSEPQWLLRATDCEKNEERHFAMKDIHSWKPKFGLEEIYQGIDLAKTQDYSAKLTIFNDDGTNADFRPAGHG